MEFHFRNDQPIYLQLIELFKAEILSGRLAPNEKLPSVRELARQARVNPNTIQKALSFLESEGLIETRRTSGKFVKERREGLDAILMDSAGNKSRQLIGELKELGLGKEEILNLIQEVLDE